MPRLRAAAAPIFRPESMGSFHWNVTNHWRSWRRPGRELLRAACDLLLPPSCPACGEPAAELCAPCRAQLGWRPRSGCPRCGEPAAAPNTACGRDHAELRHLVRHVAPLHFAGTGGALVRRFKLDADGAAGRWLARAMADAWRPFVTGVGRRACLVPVPLHRGRRAERGFDQAEWLARSLSRRLGLPVLAGALQRSRATMPQGDPRVTSRGDNVAAAFRVALPGRLIDREVILVDDVFTSGATARACASVLATAGVARVSILTACRS